MNLSERSFFYHIISLIAVFVNRIIAGEKDYTELHKKREQMFNYL